MEEFLELLFIIGICIALLTVGVALGSWEQLEQDRQYVGSHCEEMGISTKNCYKLMYGED